MLEIACFDITSAEIALQSVSDRIEFCAGAEVGGTTPNIDEFKYLKSKYSKPVYVMIRPKGGEFIYNDTEYAEMKRSIREFKNAGANGFVFGILNGDNRLDLGRNKELVDLAGEIPCTFHRAVDHTRDLFESVEEIIKIGFKCILTSGGENSAMAGKENLKTLVEKYSDQIDILIGGGVRSENIGELKAYTGGTLFHSSAILKYEAFANEDEIKKLKKSI